MDGIDSLVKSGLCLDETMQTQLNGLQPLRDVIDGLTNSSAARAMRELEKSAVSAKDVVRSFHASQDLFGDMDRFTSSMNSVLGTLKESPISRMAEEMNKAMATSTSFAKKIADMNTSTNRLFDEMAIASIHTSDLISL